MIEMLEESCCYCLVGRDAWRRKRRLAWTDDEIILVCVFHGSVFSSFHDAMSCKVTLNA